MTLDVTTSGNIPSGVYEVIRSENMYNPRVANSTDYTDMPSPSPSKVTVKTRLETIPVSVIVDINIAELERRAAIAALNRKQSGDNR
jgi:hypothetical protein